MFERHWGSGPPKHCVSARVVGLARFWVLAALGVPPPPPAPRPRGREGASPSVRPVQKRPRRLGCQQPGPRSARARGQPSAFDASIHLQRTTARTFLQPTPARANFFRPTLGDCRGWWCGTKPRPGRAGFDPMWGQLNIPLLGGSSAVIVLGHRPAAVWYDGRSNVGLASRPLVSCSMGLEHSRRSMGAVPRGGGRARHSGCDRRHNPSRGALPGVSPRLVFRYNWAMVTLRHAWVERLPPGRFQRPSTAGRGRAACRCHEAVGKPTSFGAASTRGQPHVGGYYRPCTGDGPAHPSGQRMVDRDRLVLSEPLLRP